MDPLDFVGIALSVAAGIAFGLYVGVSWALRRVEDVIADTLTATRATVFEVLAHPQLARGIQAADKLAATVGKGGMIEKVLSGVGKFLGGGK